MKNKILLLLAALSQGAQIFSGVTVYNKTPYPVKVNMWWAGARGGNNLNNPLYLGPTEKGLMKKDSYDIKTKYKVAANVYGTDWSDVVTERPAHDSFNQSIDIVTTYNSDGMLGLAIPKHTK